MIKTTMKITLVVMIAGLLVSFAYAGPISLNETQMDSVTAGMVEKVEGFVCPVILTPNVMNSPKGGPIGEGHYTIGATTVYVPINATNSDGQGGENGTGSPPGPHAQPGGPHADPLNVGYTAIWYIQ